ncbi:MAG: SCO family protein [Magnetococcales bacterium]|nr:SCO family protein [Magnetococcales bacterium]
MLLGILLIVLLSLAGYGYLARETDRWKSKQNGQNEFAILSQPVTLDSFLLLDENGDKVGVEALLGRWTLITLGYTRCGEQCPVTLVEGREFLAGQKQANPSSPWQQVQAWMISLDPRHDQPVQLREFMAPFKPEIVGLTGASAALSRMVHFFSAGSRVVKMNHDGVPVIAHPSVWYLINPEGQWVAFAAGSHLAEISYMILNKN